MSAPRRPPPVYEWQPSTAEIARRAGIDPSRVVRFDHNTSPAAPPWAVDAATSAAGGLNEYPAADYTPLRRAVARYEGVDEDWVVPGAGADELIILAAKAFLEPDSPAVVDTPSYPLFRIASLQVGARLTEVPRMSPDFEFPSEIAGPSAAARLTWLCAPHNPIGTTLGEEEIRQIAAATDGVVVVDAAYAEFAGLKRGRLAEMAPNLVVLGTMSKAFGLAGIRVGYAVARPELAAALHAVRPPGSVGSLSAALAVRALSDPAWAFDNVARLSRARDELAAGFAALGLRPLPSVTNFILCDVGAQAADLAATLLHQGLVVRSFPAPSPLADHLRFTVRSPDEHARLLESLSAAR